MGNVNVQGEQFPRFRTFNSFYVFSDGPTRTARNNYSVLSACARGFRFGCYYYDMRIYVERWPMQNNVMSLSLYAV